MRCRAAVLIILIYISTSLRAHAAKNKHQAKFDSSYSSALQAADRFLHAWQMQDHEAGIMMLSDHARQRISPDQLQDFFSPSADAAFEIEHGKWRNSVKYEFPVVLFGTANSHGRRQFGKIVIVRAGKDDWAVDRLP